MSSAIQPPASNDEDESQTSTTAVAADGHLNLNAFRSIPFHTNSAGASSYITASTAYVIIVAASILRRLEHRIDATAAMVDVAIARGGW